MPDDPPKPHIYSGAWYRERTDQELRDWLDQSFNGSPVFEGATAELDRRSSAKEAAEQMRWTKCTFWTALVLGALSIIATIVTAVAQK